MTLWQLFKGIPQALAALIVGIGMFLKNQWNQYTEVGQALWVLALVGMGVDAGISYEFGSTLSYLHAAGFALVALAFCMLPDIAALEYRKGNKVAAGWIGVACVPLGLVAFLTHVGYSSSIRVGDMQQASFHNDNVKGKEDNAKKLNEKIAFLEKRRETLDGEMAALVSTKVNGWAVNVRPSSAAELDGAIQAQELEVANEAKRKGCKTKCEGFTKQLAHLKALQAKAKEIEKNEEQHAATLAGLASARNEVASSDFVSSAAANHNDTLFKAINMVVNRSFKQNVSMDEREATNTGIMGISSIAFLLLTPLFYFAAGLNRVPGLVGHWAGRAAETEASKEPPVWERQAARNAAQAPQIAQDGSLYLSVNSTDELGKEALARLERFGVNLSNSMTKYAGGAA